MAAASIAAMSFDFHVDEIPRAAAAVSAWDGGFVAGGVLCIPGGFSQSGGQVDRQGSPWKSLPTGAPRQQAADAAAAYETGMSSSTHGGHSGFQAMVVSLEGKRCMIPAHSWVLVSELHDAVAVSMVAPTSCFYLSVGSKILQSGWTLEEARVSMDSVIRTRGQVNGWMPFQLGTNGGDFGQWNCTNPQCRARKCWPTKSRCYRCGAPKGMGRHHSNSPVQPPWSPTLSPSRMATEREQSHPGRAMQVNLSSCPTTSRKASQAARKAASAAATGFPTSFPLSKVQALELLKGDVEGELYLELQTRLAKPNAVPPKKKEDALLRKRIEKDKAKEHQAGARSPK